MLPQNHICTLLFAAMAGKHDACHFKFSAVPGFFINFTELADQDPSFRVTTLPGLGLIDRRHETVEDDTPDDSRKDVKPWEAFKGHVYYLNRQNPASTVYKVLYITRHGFGYHNYFESNVGTEAWDVSLASLRRRQAH